MFLLTIEDVVCTCVEDKDRAVELGLVTDFNIQNSKSVGSILTWHMECF